MMHPHQQFYASGTVSTKKTKNMLRAQNRSILLYEIFVYIKNKLSYYRTKYFKTAMEKHYDDKEK